MNIKNIIFDWDGTLAQTLDLWLGGYKKSLESRGLSFEAREIVEEFFHNHHEVPDRHPDIDFPAIAAETRNHVSQTSHEVNLYKGALDTLKQLRLERKPLSLVSSSSRQLLTNGLEAHDLHVFFSSTIAGDDGYGHKPDPTPFKETLERMGAAASETLIVGDSHVDIQAGKALGCRTCLFTPHQNNLFHDFEYLKSLDPDCEIDNLSAILAHI